MIQPLHCDLWLRMASAGVAAAGPAIAYYEDAPANNGAIVVHAAEPVLDPPGAVDRPGGADGPGGAGRDGFSVVDLPEVAASGTWRRLARRSGGTT